MPKNPVRVEGVRCIVEAFLELESLLQPTHGLRTNVYTYA
jgi:hypothetical protein